MSIQEYENILDDRNGTVFVELAKVLTIRRSLVIQLKDPLLRTEYVRQFRSPGKSDVPRC